MEVFQRCVKHIEESNVDSSVKPEIIGLMTAGCDASLEKTISPLLPSRYTLTNNVKVFICNKHVLSKFDGYTNLISTLRLVSNVTLVILKPENIPCIVLGEIPPFTLTKGAVVYFFPKDVESQILKLITLF